MATTYPQKCATCTGFGYRSQIAFPLGAPIQPLTAPLFIRHKLQEQRSSAIVAAKKRRADYLDFEKDATKSIDVLDDARSKYQEFISLESLSNSQPMSVRRRPMSRPFSSRDDFDFDFTDDDDLPPEPVKQEKRIVNGKQLLVNREIKAPVVRLLGPDKEMIGVKPLDQALQMAALENVDLVLVNPDQTPPLARLISWSKYKFEIEKESKKKKANATVVEVKEVRLRPGTDTNDVNVKMKSAQKFLEKGHKVKLTMRFEGRELQFKDQGKELLLKFIEDLGPIAKVEGPLNFKTGTYNIMLAPTGAKAGQPVATAASK